ncbi:MAG: hypothetical protein RIC24_05010 [Hyphomicrobiales bacterium]|jgi:hypothetical protein
MAIIPFKDTEQNRDKSTAGEDLPAPLPHPDDIIIGEDTDPKLIGPFDQQSLDELNETLDLRGHLMLEHIYELHYGPVYPHEEDRLRAFKSAHDPYAAYRGLDDTADEEPGSASTGALLHMVLLNTTIPPRLRWTDLQFMMAEMAANRANPTRRALEKALTAGRKQHHLPFKRGQAYVPAAVIIDLMEFTGEAKRLQQELFEQSVEDALSMGKPIEAIEGLPLGPEVLMELLDKHGIKNGRLKAKG